MAILPIYIAPHPVLKKKAEKVSGVDADLRKLMDDMLDTMYAANGIGLAAPQVGVSKCVLVMDIEQADDPKTPEKKRGKPLYFVNPEIVWSSDEMHLYKEGCLSLPGQYSDVERPLKVRVKYLDYHGEQKEIEADGLLSTCLQHEMDHLEGILFVDHLSTLKRDIVMRKLKKWTKENAGDIMKSHVL